MLKYTLTQAWSSLLPASTYNCTRSCLFINKEGTSPKFMLQRPHFCIIILVALLYFSLQIFLFTIIIVKKQTQPFHKILGLLAQIDAKILSQKD